jgi:hypothetical protein
MRKSACWALAAMGIARVRVRRFVRRKLHEGPAFGLVLHEYELV